MHPQIIFYSPVLFSSLGSSQTTSLLSTVIVGAVIVLATLVAVFGVDKFGRRVLLLEAGVQVGTASQLRTATFDAVTTICCLSCCIQLPGRPTWVTSVHDRKHL